MEAAQTQGTNLCRTIKIIRMLSGQALAPGGQLERICHRAPYLRFSASFIAAILLVLHLPLPPSVEAEAVTDAFVGLIQSPLVPAENLL